MGWVIPDKTPKTIITAFTRGWFRLHGAPGEIVSDEEGALISEMWGRWCDRRNSSRTLLAGSEHGYLVERHNGLLRNVIK